MKHFIHLKDISTKDLRKIISDAKKRKSLRKKLSTLEVDKGSPLKGKMLIHIMQDASNNKKINSNNTFRSYKKFIKKNKLQKKIILKKIFAPSFLLGSRQAALQAIIAKNLSCKSFIVGRDHSGYKNFYREFDSYNFCKKKQNKLGIKIEASGSPKF